MSKIVDIEQLGCLTWKDGEHGTTFDDGVLWVLEKIGELPAVQICEDAVSRQAAIDVLSLGKEILSRALDDMDVVGTDREKYSWGLKLIESNIKDIEELSSVQPQRKTGKWVNIRGDNCGDCDQCKHTGYAWMNFCPICGVDMRRRTE